MTEPTPEQEAIIDFPMAPLRVAAGAGTGKTTTMALRLAALVNGGLVEPEQALGITFTNKAAGELADRLRRELPLLAREGREIEVATYHGFAHKLLEEFGAMVGVERTARIITPGFARQLLTEALAGADCPTLDLTARGQRVQELGRLAAQLGDNLLDAAALPQRDDDEVGRKRSELAGALRLYEQAKHDLRALDYADLIRLSVRLVHQHPGIAGRIRDRYRAVLLDEYQDTNPAQRELLRRIFGGGFPVTAVGDPDQTIYEWRGASLENFAGFPGHFPGPDGVAAPTLPLQVNRRCDRHIIDLANRVRTRIGNADRSGDLIALEGVGDGELVAAWFRTAAEEATWIAGEMLRLHDEGFEWRDMAALFRKNAHIPLVRDALALHDIPVEVVSLGGLLFVPEVTEVHAWLRLIGRPDDAPALVRILVGSRFRLGLGDLAPLAAWVDARKPRYRSDEAALPGWAMLEAIDALESVDGLSAVARQRLGEFRLVYRALLEEAQGVTLAELCRSVLERIGAWPEVDAMDEAARLSARLNLYRFLDLAEEWSPLEGRPSLDAFLDYLDVLLDEAAPEELDVARLSGDDAVALITVHRAKGLEWPAVFLPALCKGTFPADSRAFDDPVTAPYLVPYSLRLDPADPVLESADTDARKEVLRTRHDSQEWRTAYVAVTRAKHLLTLTGAYWYGTTRKPKARSDLFTLAAALAGTRVAVDVGGEDAGEAPAFLQIDTLEGAPDPHFAGGWKAALAEIMADPGWAEREAGAGRSTYDAAVDQLRMVVDGLPQPPPLEPDQTAIRTSVSGLVTYAACPKRYFWNEIERLPRRPAPALRHGIDLHRRIELHNRGVVPLEEAEPDTYDLDASEGSTEPSPDAFSLFRASRFGTHRPLLVEAPFDLAVAGARVRGRIDAVYEHGPGDWEIVDYKSGRARSDPAMRVQMEAYALAATEAGFAAEAPDRITTTFVFLGRGLEEVTEEVDSAWLTDAQVHLHELVGGIEQGRFDPAPSAACRSCDFLRFCPEGRARVEAGDGP